MSRYEKYRERAKKVLATYKGKLFLFMIVLNMLSFVNTMLTVAFKDNGYFQIVSFGIMVFLIIANLSMYMVFLNAVRGKELSFQNLELNGSKIWLLFVVSLLLTVVSFFMNFVVALLLQWMPALYQIGAFVVSILIMMVEVIAAFAISDGVKGAWGTTMSAIKFVRAYRQEMFRAAGIYILFGLTVMVVSNVITTQFINLLADQETINAVLSSGNVLGSALAHSETAIVGYELIALQLVQAVVNSAIFVNMFVMYALFYEDSKDNFFIHNTNGPIVVHHKQVK